MKKLLSYLKDNKGSGIVTVMLAILFLTAFGTLALYTTYTSVEMVVSERKGTEATVNAYTCMDEIKAGIQTLASDAIIKSYNDIMPSYTFYNENVAIPFKDAFKNNMLNSGLFEQTGTFENNERRYDPAFLREMIKETRGHTDNDKDKVVTINSGNRPNLAIIDPQTFNITLKDIEIEFNDKETGRITRVQSDIVIETPDLGYYFSQYSIKGIPQFAMVANGNIVQDSNSKTVTVNGDIYADNIELKGNSQLNVINYSTLVCQKNIMVDGKIGEDPRISVDETSTVWSGNIEVGTNTLAEFKGTSYVANDLIFNGSNSTVKLGGGNTTSTRGGSYYGFGSDFYNPEESSSIISNGSKNHLDVRNLSTLTLSGYSFISNATRYSLPAAYDENEKYVGIRMGESLSTKINQLIYFAPPQSVVRYVYVYQNGEKQYEDGVPVVEPAADGDKLVKNAVFSTNDLLNTAYFAISGEPFKFENGKFVPNGYSEQVIDPGHLGDHTYEYYNVHLKPIYEKLGDDEWIVYFYLDFASREDSNKYFSDYFESFADPSSNEIRGNLLEGLQPNGLTSRIATVASGNFYEDDTFTRKAPVSDYIDAILEETAFIKEIFKNYCTTLSNEKIDPAELNKGNYPSTNPFDTYIYREKIEEHNIGSIKQFKDEDGRVVAIIVNGDYEYKGKNDASEKDLCLIIATGDVTVSADFKGLIISNSNIFIDESAALSQNYAEVLAAYSAKADDGKFINDYFKRNITKNYSINLDGTYSNDEVPYDVLTMVHYANWNEK